jgi:hypothetical protein
VLEAAVKDANQAVRESAERLVMGASHARAQMAISSVEGELSTQCCCHACVFRR